MLPDQTKANRARTERPRTAVREGKAIERGDKWGDNDLSANQKRFLAHIEAENYAHAKCWSWIAAVRAIVDYLEIEDVVIEETLRINRKVSTQAVPVYDEGRPGKPR